MVTSIFEVDNTYNFSTISTTTLSPSYTNLKLTAILKFKQAVKYSGVYNDVVTIRQRLINETGATLLSAEDATYLLFEDTYGNEILLAEDWIKLDTVVLVDSVTAVVTIRDLTTTDVTIITNTLKAMGYSNIDIKTL